ncbi:MAG: hypothetical protein V3573_02915 [Desulfovibrionaceae bacterium]
MGRLLQIRVSASTYDEQAVSKAWPVLAKLAWGVDRVDGAAYGVLELCETIADKARLHLLSDDAALALGKGPEEAEAIRRKLEQALAEWKASEANRLSDDLEEALSELEKRVEKL